MDVVLLSRIQFALTISFHYIFPPMSIGLGVLLVIMEGLWLKTRDPKYLQMTKFWAKIFGLIFAMGVVTGVVMEFQFGTNWATYSRFVGDVFGSPLAAEGVFAFFLESTFLGVVLFGWDKVGPGFHFFSTLMVCLGAHLSAVWIVVANSWQQTPAGHHIVQTAIGSRAEITDFWAMVFNPSSVDRLVHVLLGAWIAGAFLVLSVAAWYIIKNKHKAVAEGSLKIALVFLTISCLLQVGSGHSSALVVSKYQPAKLAAMEAHYNTGKANLYMFGWVDEQGQKVLGPSLPGGLGFLTQMDFNASVTGLNDFPADLRPPVQLTFQSFHAMVGLGFAFVGIAFAGLFLWNRKKLFVTTNKLSLIYLWVLVPSVLLPHIANQLGWFAAEVGRQPWIVYNLLKTADAVSKVVDSGQVLFSMILFSFIYLVLLVLFVYLLLQKVKHGPEEVRGAKHAQRHV